MVMNGKLFWTNNNVFIATIVVFFRQARCVGLSCCFFFVLCYQWCRQCLLFSISRHLLPVLVELFLVVLAAIKEIVVFLLLLCLMVLSVVNVFVVIVVGCF